MSDWRGISFVDDLHQRAVEAAIRRRRALPLDEAREIITFYREELERQGVRLIGPER